ncbi:MAG: hypothetical protein R3D30_12060 [Hyphomicrobiales bacterium]
MAAPLGLEQEREGGIAPDIDALDRVHLKATLRAMGLPPLLVSAAQARAKWAPPSNGKCVGKMPRQAPRRHQHHIERHVVTGKAGIVGEPVLRGPRDPPTLLGG